MRKITKYIPFLLLCGTFSLTFAQNIGINTTGTAPNTAAILDLNTGNAFASPNGMGLLVPNVALTGAADAVTIASPPTSLLVYVPAGSGLAPAGYYFNAGTPAVPVWTLFITGATANSWLLTGNAGTNPAANFIGTTDANALQIKVDGSKSGWIDFASPFGTFFGYKAGLDNTGVDNTGFGWEALSLNNAGTDNTAVGFQTLANNTGSNNTGVGYWALATNTSGINNTAVGTQANLSSSNANDNTAIGYNALLNTVTSFNTALGYQAGKTNTTGTLNTYLGYTADANGVGYANSTAIGNGATVTASNTIQMGNAAIVTANIQVDWTILSDRRVKRNIHEINSALGFILKIPVYYYTTNKASQDSIIHIGNPKADSLNAAEREQFNAGDTITHLGVMAQEVDSISHAMGLKSSFVTKPSTPNGLWGVKYASITPYLIQGMKEQQKEIADLKAQLDAIQALLNKNGIH